MAVNSFHKIPCWIVSCEHAYNHIPDRYQSLFDGHDDMLYSHRGWDPGAPELAKAIADTLDTDLYCFPISRLLIDPNRSLQHPECFSRLTKNLRQEEKQLLIREFYKPYRDKIEENAVHAISRFKKLIHLSVHTFTPVWKSRKRTVDIGLLYDPRNHKEKKFCYEWREKLKVIFPGFQIRMNRPYRGRSDGIATYLRRRLATDDYLGIEVEVNQKYLKDSSTTWEDICRGFRDSLVQ